MEPGGSVTPAGQLRSVRPATDSVTGSGRGTGAGSDAAGRLGAAAAVGGDDATAVSPVPVLGAAATVARDDTDRSGTRGTTALPQPPEAATTASSASAMTTADQGRMTSACCIRTRARTPRPAPGHPAEGGARWCAAVARADVVGPQPGRVFDPTMSA